MHEHPSPPPYTNPERQQLLPGSSYYAAYSGASRYQHEPYPYDPHHYCPSPPRSASKPPSEPPSDASPRTSCPIWATVLLLLLAGSLGFFLGQPNESARTAIRQRWDLDRKNHAIEVEKWSKDRDARLVQQTAEIARFKEEEQVWQEKVVNFKEEWQRMVDEETRKRERARVYWADVKGDEHCLSNGRKRYTAQLANLTPSLDAMEACRSTPITLNGVTHERPVYCENTGGNGVRGHWVADNEGVCAAYWEYVKTKDCTAPGSGYRRIEAKLGVVHAGENPEILCLTTPLNANGKTYTRPLACPDWGAHGYWGIWNVPDELCK